MDIGILVIQLIVGLICCLLGLKFQKTVIALIGFVAGLFIGDFLVNLFWIVGGLDLVIKFGFAFIFGVFSFGFFETLISFVIGFCIFSFVGDMFNGVWYGFMIGLVLGVIGGLIVNKLYKPGIIIFTSFIGSHLIADCIYTYFNFEYSYIIIFGLLFVISILIQMSTNRRKLY